MHQDRIAKALTRIEAAAQRIEAAGASMRTSGGNGELARRYEILREEAGKALQELDNLIGTIER